MSTYRTMKAGDLWPPFNPRLTDGRTGAGVDLTGATSIKVSATQNGLVLFAARTATGDADGNVSMTWLPGDTDEVGAIELDIVIEWEPGRPGTVPTVGHYVVQVTSPLIPANS